MRKNEVDESEREGGIVEERGEEEWRIRKMRSWKRGGEEVVRGEVRLGGGWFTFDFEDEVP